jgi:hypothetical protein
MTGNMFGWFRDFADPEIARLGAVPGPQLGRAATDVGGCVAERPTASTGSRGVAGPTDPMAY